MTACSQSCAEIIKVKRGRSLLLIGGYYYRYIPEHPKSSKTGYVAEHRHIMENKIGRYLEKDEVVHHINENKLDNSIENLELLNVSQHNKLHANTKRRDRFGKFKI